MEAMPQMDEHDNKTGSQKQGGWTPAAFRKELLKIMPGYEWTVHRQSRYAPDLLEATGIKSSGFNRLSTLFVSRRDKGQGHVEYVAKSAGYGTRAPWLHTNSDSTLARVLRGLQQHYEMMAATYQGHAVALQSARRASRANPSTDQGEG